MQESRQVFYALALLTAPKYHHSYVQQTCMKQERLWVFQGTVYEIEVFEGKRLKNNFSQETLVAVCRVFMDSEPLIWDCKGTHLQISQASFWQPGIMIQEITVFYQKHNIKPVLALIGKCLDMTAWVKCTEWNSTLHFNILHGLPSMF